MFTQLTRHMDFWKERLNLFIAVGPATSIQHISSPLIYYIAEYGYEYLRDSDPPPFVADSEDMISKYFHFKCTFAPKHCNYDQGWTITRDPSLDDELLFQV
jgi:hypothetical protein